jgi:hypothetical protein
LDVAGSTARLKNTSGSAEFILSRLSDSFGATISLNTGDTNKYFFGLRGLSDENFYFFNNIAGNTALTIDTVSNITAGKNIGLGGTSPTTSGTGITFPATQSASSNANTLDDYEEGTWTPVFARSTGGAITATLTTNIGKYTKIGNMVTVSIFSVIDSVSSQGSGENEIRGLPFVPSDNALGAGSVGRNDVFTTDVVHNCWVWSDSRIIFSSNVNSFSATAVNWKSGYINLTMTYFV